MFTKDWIATLKQRFGPQPPPPAVVLQIPKDVARSIRGFDHSHEWTCGGPVKHSGMTVGLCGAVLRIRSRDQRKDGPSNYVLGRPAAELNWNGLAEERGWDPGAPVLCPACRAGLTVAAYKLMRRTAAARTAARP
jgi:hypothetical protein